jgi:hypothetical protein
LNFYFSSFDLQAPLATFHLSPLAKDTPLQKENRNPQTLLDLLSWVLHL